MKYILKKDVLVICNCSLQCPFKHHLFVTISLIDNFNSVLVTSLFRLKYDDNNKVWKMDLSDGEYIETHFKIGKLKVVYQ